MHGADEWHRGRDDLVLYDGPLVVSLPNAKLRQLGQLDDNERASAISGEGGGGYSWDARVPSSCVLNVPRLVLSADLVTENPSLQLWLLDYFHGMLYQLVWL